MHRPPDRPARGFHAALRAIEHWLRLDPTVTITVYLNDDPDALLTGYTPADRVILAHRYTLPAVAAGTDPLLLERIFAAHNGHPVHPDDQAPATTWNGKRLRSLSVGDVVGIDDRHYACAPLGWTSIPAPTH